jgi:hypothetical protein
MKNITRHSGKLLILKRLKSSTMGNPKFLCFICDEAKTGFSFVTKTNSSHGYSIQNYENKNVIVEIGAYRNNATLHTIKEMSAN